MPYHLLPGDRHLQTLLRRVATEELDTALARLAVEAPAPAAVHGVRKHVKKLRGLLRLLRSGMPAFETENAALRAAAGALSSLRDADVRLATFDGLAGPEGAGQLAPLRALLVAETGAGGGGRGDPVPAAREALAQIRGRVDTWTLKGADPDILRAGLARTRRAARLAMAEAMATPTAEAMHDWRKRVKDGWYQARLLTPINPAFLTPFADQAGVLGEDLGDHHDLAVLAGHVAAFPAAALPPEAAADLQARIRAAEGRLEARIFPAGAALLSEKPKAMSRRWTAWWQDWRG